MFFKHYTPSFYNISIDYDIQSTLSFPHQKSAESPRLSADFLPSYHFPHNAPNLLLLFLIQSQPVNHHTIEYRVPQHLSYKQHLSCPSNPLIARCTYSQTKQDGNGNLANLSPETWDIQPYVFFVKPVHDNSIAQKHGKPCGKGTADAAKADGQGDGQTQIQQAGTEIDSCSGVVPVHGLEDGKPHILDQVNSKGQYDQNRNPIGI